MNLVSAKSARRILASTRQVVGQLGGLRRLVRWQMPVHDDDALRAHYVARATHQAEIRLFAEGHRAAALPVDTAAVPWWHIGKVRKQTGLSITDGVLAAGVGAPAFAIIAFAEAELPLAATIEAQLDSITSRKMRRRVRQGWRNKTGTYRLSDDVSDFESFYDEMYLPTTVHRFGGRAHVVDRERMREVFIKRGRLFFAEDAQGRRHGTFVYSSHSNPGALHCWRNGVSRVAELPPAELTDLTVMAEVGLFDAAIGEGFERLILGHTLMRFDDGVFVHKRRLGCTFRPKAPLLLVRGSASELHGLLKSQPAFVRDPGGVHFLMASGDPEDEAFKRRATSQLSETIIHGLRSVRLLEKDISSERKARLVPWAVALRERASVPVFLQDGESQALSRLA